MQGHGPYLDKTVEKLTKTLADEGLLIQAGWVAFRSLCVPKDAPRVQYDEMEIAFMSGAQHLWGSIMSMLDPGEEPSAADMRKMELITAELLEFGERLKRKLREERPPSQPQ